MSSVPALRVRKLTDHAVDPGRDYVLYWMTAQRRLEWSFALDCAVEHAVALGRPLLVFEPLRAGYRWASDRLHRFVLDGMAEHAEACARLGIAYFPYVEPFPDAGRGLLAALADRACVVVADDSPAFFLPRLLAAGARHIPVLAEAVDGNGLMPLRATDRAFPAAVHFRRFLQAKLPLFLRQLPAREPLARLKGRPAARIPPAVLARWPMASPALLGGDAAALAQLLIDHHVAPVAGARGGAAAARARLRAFLADDLGAYGERNDPVADRSSRLSPWLHFGHLSPYEIVAGVLERAGWSPERLSLKVTGKREGWWGLDAASEGFLDQVVTWRELGFVFAHHVPDPDAWASLPDWARATLEKHARDPRPERYTREQFLHAHTGDALWNAAQNQLLREGRIHNYLRMLWGKKVLEWSKDPQEALATLIELNNRFALDGRDPNSTSGITWTFGRYDHPWPPEKPIYGTIRTMSSRNTAKKYDVEDYIARYA